MLSPQKCLITHGSGYCNPPCFLQEVLTLALRTWDLSWYLKHSILIITLLLPETWRNKTLNGNWSKGYLPSPDILQEFTRDWTWHIRGEEKCGWLTLLSLKKSGICLLFGLRYKTISLFSQIVHPSLIIALRWMFCCHQKSGKAGRK